MLVHRENSLLPSSGGDPSFGAAYSVTAYPVGARASQASSGSTATTDAGHSFRVGDKALIRPGSDNVFTAAITAVTSTTIAWGAESYSVYAGDQIVNMGPDTGTTSPNYNGSPMAIYRDGDGTTQETYATVTSSSVGEYAYWHKGDGRFWELLRDGDGVVTGAVAGFGGDPNRYNVCDYGAAGDGTTDDATRIQAAIDNAEVVNGNVYLPEGTFMHSATLTISERIKFSGAGGGDYDGDDQAATIIKKSADVTSILVEDGAHYTVLEDFLVVAILSGDTTSGVEIGEATATNGVTGCELRRVNAQGLGGFGFDVRNGNAGIMDSVQASSNNSHGISLDSDASTDNVNAWTLLNCHGSGNGGDGLYLGTAKVITVIGGDYESNIGRGIYVGSNRCFVRSYSENNTGYDFEAGAGADGGWFNLRTGALASKVLLGTGKCTFIDQVSGSYKSLYNDADNVWTIQEGSFNLAGPSDDYDYVKWGMTQEDITLSTGGATTDSAATFLPANSYIESMIAYVTTEITGGGVSSFSVGDASTAKRFIADHATLTVGNGVVGMRQHEASVITASDTWDPGSLADGAGETKSITATGAAFGDMVVVGAPYDLVDMTVSAYVQAANTVEIRLQNESGAGPVDLASGTWYVKVFKASHDGPDQASAAAARITCDATPTAGAIRLTVFYRQYVAEV